jgi:hypothetical protein
MFLIAFIVLDVHCLFSQENICLLLAVVFAVRSSYFQFIMFYLNYILRRNFENWRKTKIRFCFGVMF